jgi:WD40 repeat protein
MDKLVILWDAESISEVARCTGHLSQITSVAISPDEQTLVSGGTDGQIGVWKASPGVCHGGLFPGHSAEITSVAFSPDNRHFATSDIGGLVLLWDRSTGAQNSQQALAAVDQERAVTSLAFSNDGSKLAAGRADGSISIWDLGEGGARLGGGGARSLKGRHAGEVTSVVFSPDDQLLVSAGADGKIVLWNPTSALPLVEPLLAGVGRVESLTFDHDGHLISGGARGVIRWTVDPASLQRLACERANRDLLPEERTRYFTDEEGHTACAAILPAVTSTTGDSSQGHNARAEPSASVTDAVGTP